MAIRLEYNSCLCFESYNEGIKDALSVKERILEQEQQRKDMEEAEKQKEQEAKEAGNEYVRDSSAFNFPEVKAKPLQTQKVQYVVCLNTMGQDREFTEEEVRFALSTVKFYGDEWERIEKKNLKQDIDRKLDNMEAETLYKTSHEALDEAEM